MNCPVRLLLWLALGCGMASAATAGEARPKVGLALSGGGARGFSHVGVLRALETLRVPVDCIAGTSAGAAVGAAYAMGLAPDEIEARLRTADWDADMFDDRPGREDLPYHAKARNRSEPIGITLGVGRDGLKGISGIFAGQKVELFLHRLLGTSLEYPSFDQLPIAFRAVTTDLVTGELATQARGSLVHAVRASMAVPSVFAPVRVGERLLVDGGLSQNLPVGAVRDACADIVIAVNIGSPLLKADELGSTFGVALQVINILMERNVTESMASLGPRDILISPALGDLSAMDFSRGVDGIPAGEAATLAAVGRLAPLALSETDYAKWQARRSARQTPPPPVNRVEVTPTRFVAPEFFGLAQYANQQAPGLVDTDGLEKRIRRWTGSGDFTSIAYSLRPDDHGYTLWINPHERPWGPDYLQMGIAGSSDSHGNTDFSVQTALRRTWLNRWGGEWLTRAAFGRTRELETAWFQPLGVWSLAYVQPRASISTRPERIFVGQTPVVEFDIRRREAELALGMNNELGDVRLGLVDARIEVSRSLGTIDVATNKSKIRGLRAQLTVDQLDDLDFPRRGSALSLRSFASSRNMGSDAEYRRNELDLVHAQSFGANTLRLRLRAGGLSTEGNEPLDVFGAGGFLNLSGYQPGQFLGRGITQGSLSFYNQVMALPRPFGSGLFAGVSLEAARIRSPIGYQQDRLDRYSTALFAGAATALGPVYVGLGMGQGGTWAAYLFLGRP